MKNFPGLLRDEIMQGLPGTDVQWEMASSDRMVKNFPRAAGEDARNAAVLILLYPHNGSIYTVLMQRHDYKGPHGGQISFPGGKEEEEDTDIIKTALRETYEETGVDTSGISVLGILTPLFIPVSNMLVTPVVGWIAARPAFNHRPDEVVFLFDADLKRLSDMSMVKTKPFNIQGTMIDVRYFDYDGYIIWGATAMMLYELLHIINRGALLFQG